MREKFFSLHLDFMGFWASALCALHCMAVPLVVTFGAVSGLAWLSHPWLEMGFIITSIVAASWSLGRSYIYYHRRWGAIVVVMAGFVLLILSRFAEHSWEPLLAVLGGASIAGAHVFNWRLSRRYNKCLDNVIC